MLGCTRQQKASRDEPTGRHGDRSASPARASRDSAPVLCRPAGWTRPVRARGIRSRVDRPHSPSADVAPEASRRRGTHDSVVEAPDVDEALALAEEAEAAAAEAAAAAASARARVLRLKYEKALASKKPTLGSKIDSKCNGSATDDPEPLNETPSVDDVVPETGRADATDEAATKDAPHPSDSARGKAEPGITEGAADTGTRTGWLRRARIPKPGAKILLTTLAVIVLTGLLATSGNMAWQHHQAAQRKERQAEFAAAAQQGIVKLMSFDFHHAKEDVQRIIDGTTGRFRADFEKQAPDFVKAAEMSKAVTEVNVTATGIESMSDNDAVILVAATSRVTNAAGAQQEPRQWRLSVGVARDTGQLKMSKVEFIP